MSWFFFLNDKRIMDSVYVGPRLNEQEKLYISAILKNYPQNQISHIQAFHTADFSDSEDVPGGLLMIHPSNASIHTDSLPLNAFSYLAIVPISGNHWTDADFKGKEALIHEACPQFGSKPPSLRCQSIDTPLDGKPWNSEFGEDENAFAGVFKQSKGRDTRFFIGVQAGAPLAVKELRKKINKKNLTFEQLLVDREYNYAQYLAQRNCQRLAYNVARALKVPIRSMTDMGAFTEHEYSARPKLAVPLYMQPISSIAPVVHNSTRKIGIFNKLTPIENAAPLQFVYEGPYNGIAVFAMNGKGRGYALPAHSGKVATAWPLTPEEVTKRCRDVFCEGDITYHPDMVADNYQPVDSEEFLESMKKLGWRQKTTLNNLVPVSLKIFSPEIRRK